MDVDVSGEARAGLGLVRSARPLATACRALTAADPARELPLLIEDEATRLWAQARATVDPTVQRPAYGPLYDALRRLASVTATTAEDATATTAVAFLAAYEALLAALPRWWRLEALVEVSDATALRAQAARRGRGSPAGDLPTLALQELITQSATDPDACGVEIVAGWAAACDLAAAPLRVRLAVDVIVQDLAALLDYAGRRYQECWFDDWEPASVGEALWEALVAANENPSPQELGLSLGEHAEIELAVAPSRQSPPCAQLDRTAAHAGPARP